jgi:hypothetical protein
MPPLSRPLFEPLRTLADLSASVYNLLSENQDLSIDEIEKRLPNHLRPSFERFQTEIARELLDFKYIDLANGAQLEVRNLNAVRQMGGGGKGVKRRHSGVETVSSPRDKMRFTAPSEQAAGSIASKSKQISLHNNIAAFQLVW